MNNARFTKMASAVAVAAFFSGSVQQVLADADIAVQPAGTPLEATTNVDLRVIVPELLIFGVGPVGDTISRITWTMADAAGTAVGNNQTYSGAPGAFTAPAPYSATPTATIENGGTGASALGNTATLPVFLFSNNGSDVTITSTVAGGDGTGAADVLEETGTTTLTIPIADFAAGQTGAILQPDFSAGGTNSQDTPQTDGIVNLAGDWTYTYSPAAIPQAGTYEARVTYVAAQP